jgi:dTDP-glucose pyrophosphorylase
MTASIRKGMVLAAGKGTRLYPLTLAIPKEMIRVGRVPVIEHAINVLKAGGIKDILVVVGLKKEAIMDYLGSGERFGVNIYYRVQEEPKGTAHAVYYGKDFIGNEDFVVIYGDNYFKPYNAIKEIINFHKEKEADATLVLHEVKDPTRFGIAKINNADNRVLDMIEKPTLEEAEPYRIGNSYLSIAGLIILKSIIFSFIERTKPGKNNETWLTDSIKLMRQNRYKVYGFIFKGKRYDIGTFESLEEAERLEQEEKRDTSIG